MKRKLRGLILAVFASVLMISSGCTAEHYTYASPRHKVVVVKPHPPRVYKVKRHKHRIIYYNYYPSSVYDPAKY